MRKWGLKQIMRGGNSLHLRSCYLYRNLAIFGDMGEMDKMKNILDKEDLRWCVG